MEVKTPKVPPPEEEKFDRELQILQEAALLFSERGFQGTSMREIAERVNISKPALYHWFGEKNDIYVKIILTVLEKLCLSTEEAIARFDGPSEQFRAFFVAHAQCIADNPTFYVSANFGFAGLRDSAARRETIIWRDRHENNLRNILDRGVESGDFKSLDTRIASRAMLSALTGMSRWYKEDGEFSAIEIAERFADLYLDGLHA